MKISRGIDIVDTSLFLTNEKIIIINDLHIGYEQELHIKGILVPRFQLQEILDKMELILKKTKATKVIINGDLKHHFGKILNREWKEVLQFLDFLLARVEEVIIIKGNHDPIIQPIANKRGILVVNQYKVDDTIIVHGDEIIESDAKRIIIGHEHPAITIREGSKWEKYKCFLKGKWQGKELIAVPSFNPLLEGTDVLQGKMLSPFFDEISKFDVFIVNKGEVFDFGKVREIKSKFQ
jgi:uncharacterized protein